MTDTAARNQRKIAVIGLGSMGLGMATSLARAGYEVSGCDRAPEALAAARAAGIITATDPAEAAHDADAVLSVVVNAAQTETVLFGGAGAVPALRDGGIAISCATMAPSEARRFAAAAAERGALYLDAPMSGGSVRAAEGALTFLVSGPTVTYEAARPFLEAMAQTVYHLGEDIGTGAAFKMVNQLLAGVHIAAACEALTFATKLGLDLAQVYEVISNAAGSSWMFQNRGPHVVEGDYTPRSAVEIFVKDLGIVEDIARAERFPTPLAGAALQLFLMTASAGMGHDDDASVARLYAKIAGLDLPGPAAP
ncbi:MAG: NAD(P)-dependent oxidoreductase [Alphaproteobacteria bacterium]|nr:NAD(P)-dependent oxidoreductase [Alphaproteobacteria bacterium]